MAVNTVQWIVDKTSRINSYNDIEEVNNNLISIRDFLNIDFSEKKILGGVVIDFVYHGGDNKTNDIINNFHKNYKVGKSSTIGQSFYGLATTNGYYEFINSIRGTNLWPLAGIVSLNDAADYQEYISAFIDYTEAVGVLDLLMLGIRKRDAVLGGNQYKTETEYRKLDTMLQNFSKDAKVVKFSNSPIALNTIFEGVAGCGKTHSIEELAEGFSGYELVVFHPSSSYEDFVSGLRPEGDTFVGKAGIFVQMCNRAALNPNGKYLLFIDEINRANTSKVFGDLLMVMEESKRTQVGELPERAVLNYEETQDLKPGQFVRLQTPVKLKLNEENESWEYDEDGEIFEYLAVPDNLYIVGTMNSTDRSVGTIDLALRRRFTWETIEPLNGDEIKNDAGLSEDVQGEETLFAWYDKTNMFLRDAVSPDARLGHSYFFGENKTVKQVAHDLLKQLEEIIYIFRIDENLVDKEIGPVAGKKIDFVGQGLGRRPIVVDTEDKSSADSGINESAENGDSETDSGQDND